MDFDIGESYAGLMPISKKKNETRELYFWFFPSENVDASDEILIWLNGGVSTRNFHVITTVSVACRTEVVLTKYYSQVAHPSKVFSKKTAPSFGNTERSSLCLTHILG